MLGGNNRLAATAWCRRYLVEQHPGGPESVAQHGKPVGEEGLLHLHEDLPALREKGIDALGFLLAVNCERQICAPHRLTVDSEKEAERVYAHLSEGGQIFMKMEKTF